MSDSVWPQRWRPTRLPHLWDSPGKNTGVGCHFLLQCVKVKSKSEVVQLCPTPSEPMDCSLPGSSVLGIFQARGLEWVAIASSISISRQPQFSIPFLSLHYFYRLWITSPCKYSPLLTSTRAVITPRSSWGLWEKGGAINSTVLWDGQFSSVTQSCPILRDPINRSTPGLPVHHQLPEFTKPMSIESMMPSNHLILCRPLLFLPSIFPSITVFSNESALPIRWPKYWSFSFNISPSFQWTPRTDLL